jgi:COP9 signalosome complex subunit 3
MSQPNLAVGPLQAALLRLVHISTYVSLQTPFLLLCLGTRSFRSASTVLAQTTDRYPERARDDTLKEQKGSTVTNGEIGTLLDYHIAAAMVHIGVKRWNSAQEHLSYVMSFTSHGSVHSLMIEAYKKSVLVGLIENGRVSLLPNII